MVHDPFAHFQGEGQMILLAHAKLAYTTECQISQPV